MKFAYADPPYLGCASLYARHHPQALVWDDPGEHRRLIQRLTDEYPDGWALSASAPSLAVLQPMFPRGHRVAIWAKPFCSFKPGVGVAFAWEPVVFVGGRKVSRQEPTRRDWLAENITLKKGLTGAKPPRFARWVFSLLNAKPVEDVLDDLFPGTGVVSREWTAWDGAPEIGGPRK